MSVTDLYEPYDFSDTTGPGCGVAAHCDDCLCDVDLSMVPAVRVTLDITRTSLAGRIAAQVTGVSIGSRASDWVRFFEEYLGIFERAREAGRCAKRSPSELNEIAADYQEKRARPLGRYGRQPEVKALLQSGLTLTQAADYLGVAVDEVVSCITQRDILTTQQYTTAERLLRSGANSNRDVARRTGLSEHMVRQLAAVLGVKSKAKELKDRTGTFSVDPTTHAQVMNYHFVAQLSYGTIAKATGLTKHQVAGLCRRERARREPTST